MKNLIMKFSKYFFVVFFIFQKNTNAQIGLWNNIQNKSEDKINFILFISPCNTISKVPYYGFDNSTPVSEDKLVYFQPGCSMDFDYRFGQNINQNVWFGTNLETSFSIQMISSKFCGIVGYKNYMQVKLYYSALAVKMNHSSDVRSLSKNYLGTNMPGVEIQLSYLGINGSLLYQKNSKSKFFNYKVTYNFIPNILAGGIESKSIYGSGPVIDFTFGKKTKQISVSWLTPKNYEKELYEIRKGFYIKATFPIY